VKKNEKNISVGETSGQGIVWSGNCLVGNCPVRELSLGNCRWKKCLVRESSGYPNSNLLSGCLYCSRSYHLKPFEFTYLFIACPI